MADAHLNPEPTHETVAPAAGAAPPRNIRRGESQWALILREFRRRRLAVFSGYAILILATISVFAPFLANDRPLVYEGYNRFQYREDARTLNVVIQKLAEWHRAPKDSGDQTFIDKQVSVIEFHINLMARRLPPDDAANLRALGDRLLELATSGQGGLQMAQELEQMRIDLRRQFGGRDVNLVSSWHAPVIASLNWLEIGFILLNVLILTLPAWRWGVRRLMPSDRFTGQGAVYLSVLIGLPILGALLWWWNVPDRVDRTNYKAGVLYSADADLSGAPVVYKNVLWPIVPYGLDEDNLNAKYLRPLSGLIQSSSDGEGSRDATVGSTPWDQPHWLGTDSIGRDVLSRMIWGGRVSLSVGIVAVSIYVVIGIIIGAIAGYARGPADLLISRFIEIIICFPSFFLILTIVAFVGPSIFNIMIVIGLTGWTTVARLVRGEFLRLGEQEFVLAARALGYSPLRIIFRHVLPNAMAPVLVAATFGVAGAILTESALSFLGFGITVPTPSWGGVLATGRDALNRAPWLIFIPGFAIFLTITAYNLVGEAFRDAADPRLRGQYVQQ